MVHRILIKEQIRSHVLKVLSGYCFGQRRPDNPTVMIISPWISNVELQLSLKQVSVEAEGKGVPSDTFDSWLHDVYQIATISLPHCLQLLKLDFGADISIVTLPPDENNYSDAARQRVLLDFLDEIGCNIYVNQNVHTKLILTNDLGLLGSFNLTNPALWEKKEEIGVSFDDNETLSCLEDYSKNIVASNSSKPYGFTTQIREAEVLQKPIDLITRGWLLERIIRADRELVHACGDFTYACHEFLFFNFKTIRSYEVANLATSNAEAFYTDALTAFLKSNASNEGISLFERLFGYEGKRDVNDILDFLKSRFAREHIPRIPHRIMSINPAE